MKSRQESKLSMYLAVKDFLTTNAAIVTPLPNYPGYSSAFLGAITQIQNHGEQQQFDKSGIKINKDQVRNTLCMLAMDASSKLQAYAKYGNNQLLISETKYSESDLKRATDNLLRDIVQGLYDKAQSNLTALTAYGITATTQTTLLNTINTYVLTIPKPRIGTSETKQSTLLLAGAFAAAEAALGNIDGLVDIVKMTQPNFFNGYKSVRKLILTGRSKLAVKGVVTDLVSGEPLKNAKLSFAPDGNGTMAKSASKSAAAVVKKTADKGGFIIKSMPAGIYSVTCQKTGYADQIATLSISEGELSELKLQLAKN